MRYILFRGFHPCADGKETIWINGKEIKGDWIFGYYLKAKYHWHKYGVHEDWIVTSALQNGGLLNVGGRFAVIPETVGQYIGQTDKHEKSIFEDDVLGIPNSNRKGLPAMVRYNSRTASFEIQRIGYNSISLDGVQYWGEIVGNKWSNPELLEVSK